MYHSGNRELQEHFGSTALADRLLQITHRTNFTDEDKIFIEKVPFFFLATADTNGCPDCSFKGGSPGFIQITGANTLVFPNLDSGNIAYKLLQELGGAEAIGPILLGMNKPVHVLQLDSSVREIVNMVTIAVVDAQTKEEVINK